MALSRTRITSLRCVAEAELALDSKRNYILGPNGAGKTSLLEAMFLLGRGRSFRTRQIRRLVRRGSQGFAVYGEITNDGETHRLGIAFRDGRIERRIDGSPAGGTAELAQRFPVHAIDPGSHQLIQGTPADRRRFLDWGVFHVEQGYLEAWRRYRRVLGQRNAALKAQARPVEIDAWTNELEAAAGRVHDARARYMAELAPIVRTRGAALLGRDVQVTYNAGWDQELSYGVALARSTERDRLLGRTEVGPHRAELRVALDGRIAQEEASRGQQKLVAAAMILAQVDVHRQRRAGEGTLLVDDPAAELDANALDRLLQQLDQTSAQLVITGLSASQMPVTAGFPVFHVEQGEVQAL